MIQFADVVFSKILTQISIDFRNHQSSNWFNNFVILPPISNDLDKKHFKKFTFWQTMPRKKEIPKWIWKVADIKVANPHLTMTQYLWATDSCIKQESCNKPLYMAIHWHCQEIPQSKTPPNLVVIHTNDTTISSLISPVVSTASVSTKQLTILNQLPANPSLLVNLKTILSCMQILFNIHNNNNNIKNMLKGKFSSTKWSQANLPHIKTDSTTQNQHKMKELKHSIISERQNRIGANAIKILGCTIRQCVRKNGKWFSF